MSISILRWGARGGLFATYVVLHLIVWDADTGTMLHELERPFWHHEMGENLIEKCRIIGLKKAYKQVFYFRSQTEHKNAFANVDCEWHRGRPS